MKVKHLITCGIYVSCFILFIAATATAVSILKLSSTSQNEVGLFETCSVVSTGSGSSSSSVKSCTATTHGSCKSLNSTLDAARAFYVMVTILGGLVALFAVLRMFMPQINGENWKTVYYCVGTAVFVFCFISWALGFSLFSAKFCDRAALSDTSGYKVGPSAPVMFVAWVCWGFGALVEKFVGEEDNAPEYGDDADEEEGGGEGEEEGNNRKKDGGDNKLR